MDLSQFVIIVWRLIFEFMDMVNDPRGVKVVVSNGGISKRIDRRSFARIMNINALFAVMRVCMIYICEISNESN